jgi:alkanesulfonate monooxygenase SsuD/methylene tetrahydromethanopterin reductase-like flavin-dependent oxidoreductase (luciferase family)
MEYPQFAPWPTMLEEGRYLERMGVGTVWVGDHYSWVPYPDDPLLEAWTTLAALAAQTTQVRLGTMINNVATRHPAMLAKQAATVDCISGGRLDLGLGPGYFEREHQWLGIPFLTPGQRVARFGEAVDVIDRLLRDRHLSYSGTYYHLQDAPLVPAPVQQPRPPLIIAADGKKALRIAAAHADVWVTMSDERSMREHGRLLDEYCEEIGRDSGSVERAYLHWGDQAVPGPFASRDAFEEFVGRHRDVGVRRFIFLFKSAAFPAHAEYDALVAAGHWATRQALDAFAAQAIRDLQATHSSP